MVNYKNTRVQRLREAGYKLTTARLTVLDVLESHHKHLTSTEVLEAVATIDPSIGRASVFRTLDLLTRLAIIRPTYIESSMTPHYVLLPDGHHHHIVCVNCNRTIEFDECHLEELARELESKFNVRITGHLLEFYGVCVTCAFRVPADDEV
jgi:Fur family transcriptional regulator, ferric uptake regulator